MPGGIPTLAGYRPVVRERGQGWPTLRLLTCACAAMRAVRQETSAATSPDAPLRALCVVGLCGHRSAAMRNITLARGTVQTRSASFACRHRGTRPCYPAVTCACATSARRRGPPAKSALCSIAVQAPHVHLHAAVGCCRRDRLCDTWPGQPLRQANQSRSPVCARQLTLRHPRAS